MRKTCFTSLMELLFCSAYRGDHCTVDVRQSCKKETITKAPTGKGAPDRKQEWAESHMEVLMSARRILILSAAVLGSTLFIPPVSLWGQETAAPEVANAPFQYLGEISAANTFVRSGPREGDYATMRLEKGAQITVVGIKFDWLKILPPEGSFSYVSKAFVQQYGDGKRGRVTKNDLSVRAGSSLNALKSQVQTKLMDGDEVEIIGEQDEYFQIKPPAGAYLYVKKDFVAPIRALTDGQHANAGASESVNGAASAGISTTPVEPGDEHNAAAAESVDQATTQANPANPDQQLSTTSAGQEFNALEARYTQMQTLPFDQQPIEELTSGYEKLAGGTELPESMRRIAEGRLAALKIRKQAKDELLAVRKEQEETESRQTALKAEQQELQEQIQNNAVQVFTAVGTLRASSLQRGAGRLYRLTDPESGRTLVYVRSDSTELAGYIGQFVGVLGTNTTEPTFNLNVITPTTITPVDVNEVGKKVVASIMPPSVIAAQAPASAGSEK